MGEFCERLLVTLSCSGGHLLQTILTNAHVCVFTNEPLPDSTSLETPAQQGKRAGRSEDDGNCLVHMWKPDSSSETGKLLSNPSTGARLQPLLLTRDPVRVFDSWKNDGRNDIRGLINSYANLFHVVDRLTPWDPAYLVLEKLIQTPVEELRRVCDRWSLSYTPDLIEQGSSSSALDIDLYVETNFAYHGHLSNDERSSLEDALCSLYLTGWGDEVRRLRGILQTKSWIGFDLDDTLHEFRRASGRATEKVLQDINRRYSTPTPHLREEYAKVLKEKTANAFSDGKTSFDYRRERFTTLLDRFSLLPDKQYITNLLEIYESTLTRSLELKCGALNLLSHIKSLGKKVVVITEGPQDAQERTVRALGIEPYVDFLATTNQFRASKTDGMYNLVLERLRIKAGDLAYIGDNFKRDMEPALALGIFCLYYDETKHISLNSNPPRINTLSKIQHMFSIQPT